MLWAKRHPLFLAALFFMAGLFVWDHFHPLDRPPQDDIHFDVPTKDTKVFLGGLITSDVRKRAKSSSP